MSKLFTIFIISIFCANTCFAVELELSTVIKEARKIQKEKLATNQKNEKAMQPVKNKTKIENTKGDK